MTSNGGRGKGWKRGGQGERAREEETHTQGRKERMRGEEGREEEANANQVVLSHRTQRTSSN